MKWFLMFAILVFLAGCNKDEKTKTKTETPVISDRPEGGQVIHGKTSVKKSSDFHGSGVFFGRPIKTSERGFIWNTWEAQINVGSIQNTFYLGKLIDVSIESKEVFDKFDSLDSNQTYVFHYEQPFWMNPEIEETHYLIRKIEPLSPNMDFTYDGVIKASEIEKTGGYSSGERPGKIILVRRWGFFDIDCSVELNMGNLGITTPESALVNPNLQGGGANVENSGQSTILGLINSITFNVYSEEGCAFAEQALKAGRDVVIHYTEDHAEFWDKYSRIIDEIHLK